MSSYKAVNVTDSKNALETGHGTVVVQPGESTAVSAVIAKELWRDGIDRHKSRKFTLAWEIYENDVKWGYDDGLPWESAEVVEETATIDNEENDQ